MEQDQLKDTAIFELTVYAPATDWRQEPRTSVRCYSEISRHYYRLNSQLIHADYYAYAYNPLDWDKIGNFLANRTHELEYYLQVFGLGVHDFDKEPFDAEKIPHQGYAGFKSFSLTVNILPGTSGSNYVSTATIRHDLWGNAPQDPNIWQRMTFGDVQTFVRQ